MMYTVWVLNDDFDDMLVGIATNKEKANEMKNKLLNTEGFEYCECKIVEMKVDTMTINDFDYTF